MHKISPAGWLAFPFALQTNVSLSVYSITWHMCIQIRGGEGNFICLIFFFHLFFHLPVAASTASTVSTKTAVEKQG